MDNKKDYWQKEEFENLVETALICMFEKKIKQPKGVVRGTFVSKKEFSFIKQVGPYFLPIKTTINNCIITEPISILPPWASVAINLTDPLIQNDLIESNDRRKDGQIQICIARKMPVYGGAKILQPGVPFLIYNGYALNQGGLKFEKRWVTIDKYGFVWPTIISQGGRGLYNYKVTDEVNEILSPEETAKTLDMTLEELKEIGRGKYYQISRDCIGAIWALNTYFIFDNFWKVKAKEEDAHATFGVDESQIKSLFYARNLPTTTTGRKRPILHWVSAHRRRIKEGIEIDIKEYLRGTTDFVMNGTKFEIISPKKNLLKKVA